MYARAGGAFYGVSQMGEKEGVSLGEFMQNEICRSFHTRINQTVKPRTHTHTHIYMVTLGSCEVFKGSWQANTAGALSPNTENNEGLRKAGFPIT